MSNSEEPKKSPNVPVESPTQAFRLKISEWMDEVKQDFDVETPAPTNTPPARPAPPPPPPPRNPPKR